MSESKRLDIYHTNGDSLVKVFTFNYGIVVECAHKGKLQISPCPISLPAGRELWFKTNDSNCLKKIVLNQPLAIGDRYIETDIKVDPEARAICGVQDKSNSQWSAAVRNSKDLVLMNLICDYTVAGGLKLIYPQTVVPVPANISRSQVGVDEKRLSPYYWDLQEKIGNTVYTHFSGLFWLVVDVSR